MKTVSLRIRGELRGGLGEVAFDYLTGGTD